MFDAYGIGVLNEEVPLDELIQLVSTLGGTMAANAEQMAGAPHKGGVDTTMAMAEATEHADRDNYGEGCFMWWVEGLR